MRYALTGVLGLSLLLGAAGTGWAGGCGSTPTDEQAVIDARAAAEDQCHCATATDHGDYVSCVAGVAKARSETDPPQLPKYCKGKVKKCAAKSTCGKPGF